MTKIIWFNQPTNHSGSANFLFLTPDNEIDHLSIYMADPVGPYILGGPALAHDYGYLTEAAITLISLLPAGFHFFPDKKADILETVTQAWEESGGDSNRNPKEYLYDWGLLACAKDYDAIQCCEMLRNDRTPDIPMVFVQWDEHGDLLLGAELARIYYNMSKEQREELGLKQDWRHALEA